MADQDIQITISARLDSLTAAVNQANGKILTMKRQAQSADAAASKMLGNKGHGTVTSVQAASAAIRAANGDMTHMVRTIEVFVGKSALAGKALKALFPLIGGAAFGIMLANLTGKIVEFYKEANTAPQRIRDGFATMSVGAQLANDELELTNAKLESSIAKLEHKPQNALAAALAEVKVEADKAAESADTAYNKVKALLSTNRISLTQALATGNIGTSNTEGTINSYNEQIAQLENTRANQVSDNPKASTAAIDKQIADKIASARATYQKGVDYYKPYKDGQANVADFSGALRDLDQRSRNTKLQQQNDTDVKTHDTLQAKKDLATERQEDAQKAAEKVRQQQEAIRQQQAGVIKSDEDALEARKAVNDLSQAQVAAYWTMMARNETNGSLSYTHAIEQANKAIAAQTAETAHLQTQYSNQQADVVHDAANADLSTDPETSRGLSGNSRASQSHLNNLNASIDSAQQFGYAQQQQGIEIDSATGKLSRYDAALQLMQLHSQEAAAAQSGLKAAIEQASVAQPGVSANDQAAKLSALNLQLQQLQESFSLSSVADSAHLDQTTLATAWKQSLDTFVQQSKDAAGQIGGIFTDSLGSINGTLATNLTAHYHTSHERWRDLRNGLSNDVRGAGTKLTNYGLQKAEGSVLGAFGFGGKADGSQAQPFWVRMAGGIPGIGGSTPGVGGAISSVVPKSGGGFLANLLGMAGNGQATINAAQNIGPGMSDLASTPVTSTIAPEALQGFFANGGDVVANRPAIIGEKGPELFMPTSAGRIIPNNQLSLGGDTHHHNWQIDARGATDPGATEAAIRRATPQIAAAAMKAMQEHSARRPASSR